MGRVPDMQSLRGSRWSEFPATACATFPTCRYLLPAVFGDTIIRFVLVTLITATTVAARQIVPLENPERSERAAIYTFFRNHTSMLIPPRRLVFSCPFAC